MNESKKFKVSRQSWHYRFLWFLGVPIPENLCSYFWKTVMGIVFFLMVCYLCTMAGYGALALFVSPFVTLGVQAWLGFPLFQTFAAYAMGGKVDNILLTWVDFLPSVFIIYIPMVFVGYALWYHSDKQTMKRQEKMTARHSGNYVEKPAGLVKARYRAWKNKHCPLVEIVD